MNGRGLSGSHPATTQSLINIAVGVAAIALAIIGLAKGPSASVSLYLDAVACIVLGLGLLFVGWTVLEEYAQLLAVESPAASGLSIGGVTVELFLGGAIIVLGILALLQIFPPVLIAVQMMLVGAGLALSSGTLVRVEALRVEREVTSQIARAVSGEIASSAASVQVLAGLAAFVLGILAVVGIEAMALTLIAAIVVGVALALNGTSLSGWIVSVLSPRAIAEEAGRRGGATA